MVINSMSLYTVLQLREANCRAQCLMYVNDCEFAPARDYDNVSIGQQVFDPQHSRTEQVSGVSTTEGSTHFTVLSSATESSLCVNAAPKSQS